jgi:hypothetical protein
MYPIIIPRIVVPGMIGGIKITVSMPAPYFRFDHRAYDVALEAGSLFGDEVMPA